MCHVALMTVSFFMSHRTSDVQTYVDGSVLRSEKISKSEVVFREVSDKLKHKMPTRQPGSPLQLTVDSLTIHSPVPVFGRSDIFKSLQ
jgi:hypothetical protein